METTISNNGHIMVENRLNAQRSNHQAQHQSPQMQSQNLKDQSPNKSRNENHQNVHQAQNHNQLQNQNQDQKQNQGQNQNQVENLNCDVQNLNIEAQKVDYETQNFNHKCQNVSHKIENISHGTINCQSEQNVQTTNIAKIHASWTCKPFRFETPNNISCKYYDNNISIKESIDEPMDLTCSPKTTESDKEASDAIDLQEAIAENTKESTDVAIYDEATSHTSIAIAKIMEADNYISTSNAPKKRGRKRKISEENYPLINNNKILQLNQNIEHNPQPTQASDYMHHMDQKQAEVLKAAKSLFSKRTRTLYHWMYPNTPKTQLKAAVSLSWETLGVQEKEFYISQVLGRFGFPQNSLMVNPQLDGIRVVPFVPQLDCTRPLNERNIERPNLLIAENIQPSWPLKPMRASIPGQRAAKKRGRIGRPPGSRNKPLRDDENVIKQIQCESTCDDFQDDPELCREFEQFKWTLHLTDDKN